MVESVPACRLWAGAFGVVPPVGVGAVCEFPVDVETRHEAVGGYGVEEGGDGAEEERRLVHDWRLYTRFKIASGAA